MFTIFVPKKTASEIARIICDPSLNSNPLELTALNIDLAAYDLDLSPGKVVIRQKIFNEQVTSQESDKPVILDKNKTTVPAPSVICSSRDDDTLSVTSEVSTYDELTLNEENYENKEPIKIISLDDIKKIDFTNSNIVYVNINGKIINKPNYSSIIREIYSIIHVPEKIIKESTLKIHAGIKKDCGYRYYEELNLSLPPVQSKLAIKEILYMAITFDIMIDITVITKIKAIYTIMNTRKNRCPNIVNPYHECSAYCKSKLQDDIPDLITF